MPSHQDAEALYTECMNCANTTAQCPGTWKDVPRGIPPRGFFFQRVPVKILVVGKNPGHPLQGETKELTGRDGRDLYVACHTMQERHYADLLAIRERSITFHTNLFRYLSYFLDVPESEIWNHAALTNLVKCSTPGERDLLDQKTMSECYSRYFVRELAVLRPQVLLALGREVEKYLRSRAAEHRLPVVYIKHPSYYYRRDAEAQILLSLKNGIRGFFCKSMQIQINGKSMWQINGVRLA